MQKSMIITKEFEQKRPGNRSSEEDKAENAEFEDAEHCEE